MEGLEMKILVVTKESKYEYDRRRYSLDHEAILAKYRSEHANVDEICESHARQVAARDELKRLLPEAEYTSMEHVDARIEGYDLVVSFGGDNLFTYVSHFLDGTKLVGVNSDLARSTGALCRWSARDLKGLVHAVKRGECRVEEWTRLSCTIDGKEIVRATSEYVFSEERPTKDMTTQVIRYRGKETKHKSTSIIVATGAGSTGYYASAAIHTHPDGCYFSPMEKKVVFTVESPYLYGGKQEPLTGELGPGEELEIYSLNDQKGIAQADSWTDHPFVRGSRAVIRIADEPLRVVVPKS